jgi:hypothetical protein
MHFTCRITSKEYAEALRLKRKNLRRIVLGVLGLDSLLWIWWMILAVRGDSVRAATVFGLALPFLAWTVFTMVFLRITAWFSYRNNRNIQSEIVYSLTEERVGYTSSSGGSGETPWSSLNYWRESTDVFILVFPSNAFLVCPKRAMSTERQDEFRGIVGRVLKKK